MSAMYIDRKTGLAVTVADGVELPTSMYRRAGDAVAPEDLPLKDVLVEQAERLGIEVPPKATKAEIAALIDECAISAAIGSEDAREAVPQGVAPDTNTEPGAQDGDPAGDTTQDDPAGDTPQGDPAGSGE